MKVYDFDGVTEKSFAWLQDYFGDIRVNGTDNEDYRVSTLTARSGDSALVVKVLDKNGSPVSGIDVAFYWPDAPEDPNAGWYGRCVVGKTDASGCVGFGMGGGAYYWVDLGQRGPHAVWIYGDSRSEMVDGLGMLAGTNHEHVNVEYTYGEGEEPPEPPPSECPVDEILDIASRIEVKIVSIENDLAELRNLLSE